MEEEAAPCEYVYRNHKDEGERLRRRRKKKQYQLMCDVHEGIRTPAYHCVLATNEKKSLIIIHRCGGECNRLEPLDAYEYIVQDRKQFDCVQGVYDDNSYNESMHACHGRCTVGNTAEYDVYPAKRRIKCRYSILSHPVYASTIIRDGLHGTYESRDGTTWKISLCTVPTLKEFAIAKLGAPYERDIARNPNVTIEDFDFIHNGLANVKIKIIGIV